MFKKLSTFMLTVVLLFSTIPPLQVEAAGINIDINGSKVAFTESTGAPFLDAANRTQVPFRQTMEMYGAIVSWDEVNQTAIAEKDGVVVEVPIGENYIYKDKEIIANDTAAVIKEDRTYLPIRAVLEAFGAEVSWNPNSQSVIVSTNGQNDLMTMHFIDVGQGDAIFIDYGDYEILVDAGDNSAGMKVVNYITPYVDGNLELVIATHAHADHIGGLDTVLNSFQVDRIIDSGDTATTKTYQDYYMAASSEPNCVYQSDEDLSIDLGNGAIFKVIETGDGNSNLNNNSVVTLLDYQDVEVLLTGDMDASIEKTNLSKFQDVDVLKAGHHGSYTASSQEFLQVITPEVVIVSCAFYNSYGHPHKQTLARFLGLDALIYGTYKSGDIVMVTDGNTYSFNTNKSLTLSDANATFL